jgi:Asp-tRNA(Asn)/Glu-tRNA(Gln) amidotransferase A subunit family amidase
MTAQTDLTTYLDEVCTRIEDANTDLYAFVAEPARAERVRAEAARLESRQPEATEESRAPLCGVPLGVKDVFRVDGLPTRAGSAVPAEALSGPEASAVTGLRAAGAVVVGKTVTAEFAFLGPGPTRNPRHHGHTPGGSSSGSAAAVAAGLVPLALGTQTVGSVIRPAAYCGIFGFKPTYGRIPCDGVIANAPTFDTVGVLGADVAWLEVAAEVLCRGWRPATVVGPPTLAVPDGPYLDQVVPEAREAFEAQVRRLAAAGLGVCRVPAFADIVAVNQRNATINLVELARSHEALFPVYGSRYQEVTATAIRDGQRVDPAAYEEALAERERFAADLVAVMDAEGFDAWLAPAATGPAPQGIETTGSPVMNLPWTQARLPVVGVPAGHVASGLPLGVQVVGRPGADETLIRWGADIAAALSPAG